MTTYHLAGSRITKDVEEYLRWLGRERNIHLDPEVADYLRTEDAAESAVDSLIDEAAAKFEDREPE